MTAAPIELPSPQLLLRGSNRYAINRKRRRQAEAKRERARARSNGLHSGLRPKPRSPAFSFTIGRRTFSGETFRELVKSIQRYGYRVYSDTEGLADVYVNPWGRPVTITTETTFCGFADVVRDVANVVLPRKAVPT